MQGKIIQSQAGQSIGGLTVLKDPSCSRRCVAWSDVKPVSRFVSNCCNNSSWDDVILKVAGVVDACLFWSMHLNA